MQGPGDQPDLATEDGPPETAEHPANARSLAEDLELLADDARTWFDAELSYQKSRAGFVAEQFKASLVAGIMALSCVLLATVGLALGAILALTPLIGAWAATALVVALLLLAAWLLSRRAAGAWARLLAALEPQDD